ncbi:type II toxin-antitoxin system VapB family antitoxin [Treponema sp. OMZ 840]|uniref:type II toxin-antitoxin system VapB family antitoxin n=1 Tax=Treponema sp. OMZ 840 TaxID=244313 RepID=UPI003D944922
MRTNIVLDEALVEEAFKYAKTIQTKKELIETALKEFVKRRKMKDLRELQGKIEFAQNQDHKKKRVEQ